MVSYLTTFFNGITLATLYEWPGCWLRLLSAMLVALVNRYSRFAFYAFLASNFAWIGYGQLTSIEGLKVQHVGFIIMSLLGIFCWRKRPGSSTPLGASSPITEKE